MSLKLINFVFFQIGWFTSVLGAANDLPFAGPLAAIPILLWHLSRADAPKIELLGIGASTILGAGFDQLLVSAGWVEYRGGTPGILPLWMIGLWVMFCTTLNVALRWMRQRWIVAAIFGVIGGPLAYLGGVKLGATNYIDPSYTLIAAAIGWGILTPIFVAIAARFDGYSHV